MPGLGVFGVLRRCGVAVVAGQSWSSHGVAGSKRGLSSLASRGAANVGGAGAGAGTGARGWLPGRATSRVQPASSSSSLLCSPPCSAPAAGPWLARCIASSAPARWADPVLASEVDAEIDMRQFRNAKYWGIRRHVRNSRISKKYRVNYFGRTTRPDAKYRLAHLVRKVERCEDVLALWTQQYARFSHSDRCRALRRLGDLVLTKEPQQRAAVTGDPRFANLLAYVLHDVRLSKARYEDREKPLVGFALEDLTDMAMGLLFLDHRNDELLEFLEGRLAARPWIYGSNAMSAMLLTFQHFGSAGRRVWRRCALDGPYRIRKLSSDVLPDILFAYVMAEQPGLMWFRHTAALQVYRLRNFYPPAISRTLVAFALAGMRDEPRFVRDLCAELTDEWWQDSLVKADSLADTAWAMVSLGQHANTVEAQRFFHMLNPRLLELKDALIGTHVADFAWAYARSGLRCDEAFEALRHVLEKHHARFVPAELETTKWAFEQRGYDTATIEPLQGVEAREHRPDTVEAQRRRTFSASGLPHWNLPFRFYDTDATDWAYWRFKQVHTKLRDGSLHKRAKFRRRWRQLINRRGGHHEKVLLVKRKRRDKVPWWKK